ncbi:MAG: hypothetical protein RIS70_3782 [Planctomycetota bacterium]|jgi:iron(III) transport system substrate-binding protein
MGTFCAGCDGPSREVVVYVALDREFSEPLLEEFRQRTGVKVLAKYDVESTKTVGLMQAILQESRRPRCDLFWNNEILHTLRLEQEGLLEAYVPSVAHSFPSAYKSPTGCWTGFAARARVLLVNTELVALEEFPRSIVDLVDPKWKGKVGIAKPLFGTTATHAAVLYSELGRESSVEFFKQLQANAQVLSGNKQVAMAVAQGQLAFGLTDTDDAIVEQDRGALVEIVFPDQGEGELGTLLIPNTLALIKNSRNSTAARSLIDFLLTPQSEARLAAGDSGQFPLNSEVQERSRVQPDEPVQWMQADFAAAAANWEEARRVLAEIFHGD